MTAVMPCSDSPLCIKRRRCFARMSQPKPKPITQPKPKRISIGIRIDMPMFNGLARGHIAMNDLLGIGAVVEKELDDFGVAVRARDGDRRVRRAVGEVRVGAWRNTHGTAQGTTLRTTKITLTMFEQQLDVPRFSFDDSCTESAALVRVGFVAAEQQAHLEVVVLQQTHADSDRNGTRWRAVPGAGRDVFQRG